MSNMYDNGIGLKKTYSVSSNFSFGYNAMPQKQERKQDKKKRKKPDGVPGVDLPEIDGILDGIDGILDKQPDPEDFEQPNGQ